MPELPEVQTIVNELENELIGKKITACKILRETTVRGVSDRFEKRLINSSFKAIERRGKYIIMSLSSYDRLVIHLRMTGKFVLQPKKKRQQKHDRVIFQLDNHQKLIFSDVRCFGTIELLEKGEKHIGISKLGPEPWSRQLTPATLREKLSMRKISIKTALLDQSLVAGLGNIYASELLFDSGIDPRIPANRLSEKELASVIRSMRKILRQALEYNGTSISDYRRVDEKQGMFQRFLKVYGKAGQKCVVCSSTILKIKQNQRSTFLCPQCQK